MDTVLHMSHNGGGPVQSFATAGFIIGWWTTRPSQYISVEGGCAGQIEQEGKQAALLIRTVDFSRIGI